MRIKNLLVVIPVLVLFVQCKSKKAVVVKKEVAPVVIPQRVNAEEMFFDRVKAAKNTGESFSYNAEVDYKDKDQAASFSMEVVARRNQYIFLNAKALGFVNVARVMIQPDSIRILDLINRKYISASYSFMKQFTSAPIGFEQLQNMAWANATFDPMLGKTVIDSSASLLKLLTTLSGVEQFAFYSRDFITDHVVLSEQSKARNMVVRYVNPANRDGIHYPQQILINIEGEKKVDCKFVISNFAGTIKKEPQFVVPRTYKTQVY